MNTSISGLLIGGLLIIFGAWQYAGQKGNLAELTRKDEKTEISSLRAYLIRQTRRRMTTAILFFLAGIAVLAGFQIAPQIHPGLSAGVWLLSIAFLLGAILLTIIDIFEIRFRLNEEKSVEKAAQKGLEYLRTRNNAQDAADEGENGAANKERN